MSAVILAFPRPAPEADSLDATGRLQRTVIARECGDFLVTSSHLQSFTPAWCAQHLPLIDAAMELLEADDDEFARRCQAMRDEEGRAMLGELAGQLQRLGAHIADVADALGLTAERIRDAMAALPR